MKGRNFKRRGFCLFYSKKAVEAKTKPKLTAKKKTGKKDMALLIEVEDELHNMDKALEQLAGHGHASGDFSDFNEQGYDTGGTG